MKKSNITYWSKYHILFLPFTSQSKTWTMFALSYIDVFDEIHSQVLLEIRRQTQSLEVWKVFLCRFSIQNNLSRKYHFIIFLRLISYRNIITLYPQNNKMIEL